MQTKSLISLLALASVPLASASNGKGSGKSCSHKGLDWYAKKAGLKYFGAATDSPGQRERAGLESAYPKYDEIMWKSGEFGQTTPTNGQKVCIFFFFFSFPFSPYPFSSDSPLPSLTPS